MGFNWLSLGSQAQANKNASKIALTNGPARLQRWANQFVRDLGIGIMASPPTVTLPGNSSASTINGSGNAAGLPAAGLYPKLNYAGGASYAPNTGNPNNNCLVASGPANTDASLPPATLLRARFTTILPQFEVVYAERTGSKINALIDGQLVASGAGVVPNPLQSGGTRYLKFDFGADTTSYGYATGTIANFSAAGTGYTQGDTLTMVGGTFTRAATFRVTFTNSGAVGGLNIQDPGSYTVLPSFPAATTGGTGTGCTISQQFLSPQHTTLKPRRVELLIEGAWLYGINYTAPSSGEPAITPYYFNPVVPKLYWLGDSQDANTYGTFAGGEIGFLVAQRLGLGDNLIIDARGGTGFNVANGTAPAFDHANRVNAIIAAAPDILFVPYSQNVGSNTQATSQAAALSLVNQVQAALPNCLIVMCGPANGYQSWHLAAMNYVKANCLNSAKLWLIDNITAGWTAGGSSGFLVSDNQHWGQWGNINWRSQLLAEEMAYGLQSMIAAM